VSFLEIKLTFVGDVMMDGSMITYLDQYRDPTGKLSFSPMFEPMRDMFSSSDYVLANLETPLTRYENDYTNKRYEFCTGYEFAEALHNVGVDYVSTANNHCLDRGIPGLIETVTCLDQIGLQHSGVDCPGAGKKRLVVDVNGIRIGLLSYTYGTNAVTNGQYLGLRSNRKLVNLIQEQEGAVDFYDPSYRYARSHPGGFIARIRNKIMRMIWPENEGKLWVEKTTVGFYRRHVLLRELRDMKKLGTDMTVMYLHVGGQYNAEPNHLTKKTIKWLLRKKCNIIIGNHEHIVHGCVHNLPSNQFATYAIGNFVGSAGTMQEPYDRYAEYSVAVHAYIDRQEKTIKKVTFSVLVAKCNKNGTYEVWPVTKLLSTTNQDTAAKLIQDSLAVAKIFSGHAYDSVQDEFPLCRE
jgi:poly-gamma-glutamate synthesis protein (capsule biosynthesis protein)